jgi:NADH-quinone oxidoreductase subunit J
MPNFFYDFQFYLFGLIAIASAITFVTRRSPVAAAMWLVVTMFMLAALYVMLGAEFVGAVQVIVYAGAIMVVFLFVVMLLNLGHPRELLDMRGRWGRLLAGLVGLVLLAQMAVILKSRFPLALPQATIATAADRQLGVVGTVARPLFNEYLLVFELTSILLLVAIVGAVVIGKRRSAT